MSSTPSLPTETPKIKLLTVTEIRFHNRMSVEWVIQYLRGLRATGEMRISFSEGGVNGVVFEGRTITRNPS